MPPRDKSATSLASNKSFTNPFNLSLAQLHANVDTPVYYVGVDVGTGSARAAVVDQTGSILGLAERPITRWELKQNYINQSTTEVWQSICYCVKTALSQSHIDASLVMGIGFDATCSLAVINERNDEPVPVGPDWSAKEQNILLWMDHRAGNETDIINATGDKCLKYVGGKMSIEMELPKMKWLKHNMPKDEATGKSLFESCKFYDLADYLTHRATDKETRSFCSVVCKQGFVPPGVDNSAHGWSKEFLEKVDLPELVEDDFRRLGGIPGKNGTYLSAGDTVGPLSEKAADELGLTTDCFVASGVIDAYAGWVGTIAAKTEIPIPSLNKQDAQFNGIDRACGRLAAVAGTSTCHIAMSKDPIFVQGVWGPYRDVMAKGYWLAEGGQSCTGALLAHVLSTHPALTQLSTSAEASGLSKFDFLNSRLEHLKKTKGSRSVVSLAKNFFFYGDFHGNRSPIADPHMSAAIIGQSMDVSLDDLAITYLGACEFIAQQTRHIISEMEKAGHEISCIFLSGGQCRNGLLMRLLADCTGLPIIIPRYIDASVVFGAALLGAVSAEDAIKARKQNSSKKNSSTSLSRKVSYQDLNATSPYTVPTATASLTSISAMAAANFAPQQQSGHFPFPLMTPIEDESKQLQIPKDNSSDEDNDGEDEEEIVSFGSKTNTQAKFTDKFIKDNHLNATSNPRTINASKPTESKSNERSGDKLWKVMETLSGMARVIVPSSDTDPDRKLLNVKYKIFLEMADEQRRYRSLVSDIEDEIKQESTAATTSSTTTVTA
ncbi:hypothetical protein PACTADRAFT_44897 [Pachysolen tannophilus NRRL Y-2460]|uniref:Carbohydrate kinase FGGY C-terminal domain-containing protein n=1 Tax=Pachysolen tannophilus NRRL Y-2460 TaxID=669874 RepID=A0A1E4TRL0_PACTA|nr:hypothetical protein PACTADRAFT_44897 [Pachysolen tannophilus NRRL Y-2460]